MNAIQTYGLTKRYKGKTAVDHLDLAVRQGELFSILGVNGAGKTTAIKMLVGLLPPTEGSALLLGENIRKIKSKINLSPQQTAIAPKLTVRENLEFIDRLYGFEKKQARQKAAETIRRLSLTEVQDSRAQTLSGGWQRRLSIAMAIITQPQILFLDEPTLGLDILARRELWKMIEDLKGSVTIILTTHYLEEAAHLSDRIGIMANGKLAAVGTAQELMQLAGTSRLEDAFVALCGKEEHPL